MMIREAIEEIKTIFEGDASGHDYWHTMRVYQNAVNIAENMECDKTIVALGALLHDVDDAKLFDTSDHQNTTIAHFYEKLF